MCDLLNRHAEGNALTYDDMKNKLKLVRAIADEIWPGQLVLVPLQKLV